MYFLFQTLLVHFLIAAGLADSWLSRQYSKTSLAFSDHTLTRWDWKKYCVQHATVSNTGISYDFENPNDVEACRPDVEPYVLNSKETNPIDQLAAEAMEITFLMPTAYGLSLLTEINKLSAENTVSVSTEQRLLEEEDSFLEGSAMEEGDLSHDMSEFEVADDSDNVILTEGFQSTGTENKSKPLSTELLRTKLDIWIVKFQELIDEFVSSDYKADLAVKTGLIRGRNAKERYPNFCYILGKWFPSYFSYQYADSDPVITGQIMPLAVGNEGVVDESSNTSAVDNLYRYRDFILAAVQKASFATVDVESKFDKFLHNELSRINPLLLKYAANEDIAPTLRDEWQHLREVYSSITQHVKKIMADKNYGTLDELPWMCQFSNSDLGTFSIPQETNST